MTLDVEFKILDAMQTPAHIKLQVGHGFGHSAATHIEEPTDSRHPRNPTPMEDYSAFIASQ